MKPYLKNYLLNLPDKYTFLFTKFYYDAKQMIIYNKKTNVFMLNDKFVDYISILLEFEDFTCKLNNPKVILELSYIFYDSIKYAKKSNIKYNIKKANEVRFKVLYFYDLLIQKNNDKWLLLDSIRNEYYDIESYFNNTPLYISTGYNNIILDNLVCDNDFLKTISIFENYDILNFEFISKVATILDLSINIKNNRIRNENVLRKVNSFNFLLAKKLYTKFSCYLNNSYKLIYEKNNN